MKENLKKKKSDREKPIYKYFLRLGLTESFAHFTHIKTNV